MQILRVLARHGFLGVLRGRDHWPSPKAVRETIEELGLTFIKFGQVLALRRDLLPEAYLDELELLHDQLPAIGINVVRTMVESELGSPLKALFSTFSEMPIAAATIAQVHDATLKDGRHVAVKVQRPGLQRIISKDIAAMSYLVSLGEGLFPQLRALDLSVVVREFSKSLNRETDFRHEAHSIVLFRAALADVPDFWIPDVIPEVSSGRLLTMDYSPGTRVDLYGKQHPEAMPKAINTLVKLMLHTIFEEGLFHADPHPGNVFVLPDGRLSLLDFGMTGELDEAMRDSLTLLLEAVVKGDARATTEAYLEMGTANESVNRAALLVDIKAVLYEIHRHDMANVSIGNAFDALLRAGSQNGVHNPGEFFLLTRAFVILESMIRQLSPEHNYIESFREEIARLTEQHFSLVRIKDKTTNLAREMERLVSDAPSDTRRILRRFAEGNLGRVQSPALEALGDRVSNNLERLASSVAFSALVVGGSLLLFAQMGGWHHRLGEAMVVSGILGMVLRSIGGWLRNRRRQ
jgi:ubiquinone biosynthesis protein